jgi:hypothetical protein
VNLRPGELVFGCAPEILLDCARQLHEHRLPFGFADFCRALGASERECRPVFDQMLHRGYFEAVEDERYGPTELLNKLALAEIGLGISRSDAEALLRKVIAAARRINSDPDSFKCRVRRLAVFGSYLSNKATLGDLDIAADVEELKSTRTPEEAHEVYERLRSGKSLPINRAYGALRLRKPKLISLHTYAELIELKTPFKVVFPVGEVP